jgi:hypothetical protein
MGTGRAGGSEGSGRPIDIDSIPPDLDIGSGR